MAKPKKFCGSCCERKEDSIIQVHKREEGIGDGIFLSSIMLEYIWDLNMSASCMHMGFAYLIMEYKIDNSKTSVR